MIEIKELSFSYQTLPVIEGASFTIQEGEYVAIFGPNGGGKTTLLNLLMGFRKPTQGTIEIFGKAPKHAQCLMGWVPQNFHFDPHFPISVQEVVLGGRHRDAKWRFHADDLKIVEEVLEMVGMKKTLKAPFPALSGGQQQRVLIARALASKPKLLLLDEPTAGVDLDAEREIYALLNRLRKQMTILMVTHDLNRAVESVDRLFCVQKTVTEMAKEKVCEHFALGLYHAEKK